METLIKWLFCPVENHTKQHTISHSTDRTYAGKKLYLETTQCTSCKHKETKVTDSNGNLLSQF